MARPRERAIAPRARRGADRDRQRGCGRAVGCRRRADRAPGVAARAPARGRDARSGARRRRRAARARADRARRSRARVARLPAPPRPRSRGACARGKAPGRHPRHRAQASREARSAARAARRNRGAPVCAGRVRRCRGAGRARGQGRARLSRGRRPSCRRSATSTATSSRIASPKRCRRSRWPAAASKSRSSPRGNPASYGLDDIEFRVAGHPKQPLGSLARVASGGELSRIALALSGGGERSGLGAHARVRRSRQRHRRRRRRHGGPVAANARRAAPGAVRHAPAAGGRVRGRALSRGQGRQRQTASRASSRSLAQGRRVEELARMLGGAEVTAKTRAHAKELYEQHQRVTKGPR